jgi:hypothetical protein
MMVFPFTTLRRFLDYELAPYANIAAYLARISASGIQEGDVARGPTKTYV